VGFFDGTRPGTAVRHGEAAFDLPILYFRDDCFGLFYAADEDRARRLMPSGRLHPVRLGLGRTLVGVIAFNYIDTSIGPYGEVAVVVPVVHSSRPPPPLLPAVLQSGYPGFGMVVLHLPVTGTLPRDAGRGQWGYPKFVADMHFTIAPEYLECRMTEEEAHVLTLRVARQGLLLRDASPLVTYTVRDGALVKTLIPSRGIRREGSFPQGCKLELGDHPVADTLRQLELSRRPLMSRYYPERSAILPAGDEVEQGVASVVDYGGTDREGTYAVRFLDEAE